MTHPPSAASLLLSAFLALASLGHADDALQEVARSEALESTTHLVLARNTGHTGSAQEKQKEGYSCTLRYESWVVESLLDGSPSWKPGDSLKVFHPGQEQNCGRAHEYRTTGLDVGLFLPYYTSPTKLENQSAAGARGILLGRPREGGGLELSCPWSIETPDQADTLRQLMKRKGDTPNLD